MLKLNKKNLDRLASDKGFKPNSADMPIKILQFGEGNFLRAFVDWMIDIINEKENFNGSVRIVQPLEQGLISMLNDQDGLYTVITRGIRHGETVQEERIVTSVERGINPYSEHNLYLESARLESLRYVFSNTTEAGIAYNPGESVNDRPPKSFPGKVTQMLYERFSFFQGAQDKGLVFIPCELIDKNGDNLKAIILNLIDEWKLGEDFKHWVEKHNIFMNSLVDRIVTGYPRNELDELQAHLGYEDNLLDTCEDFHLWVIEGDTSIQEELPFAKAGLNVIWTEDMSFYRTRKVRILNGVHTSMVLAAYLYGKETVRECLEDETVKSFIMKALQEDIIPSLSHLSGDIQEYADAVLERFANPFIVHLLLSISLNSISKFKTRVLPSFLQSSELKNEAPDTLSFSLAGLISFFKPQGEKDEATYGLLNGKEYPLHESKENLHFMGKAWSLYDGTLEGAEKVAAKVLSNQDFWGQDLRAISRCSEKVAHGLHQVQQKGMPEAMKELLDSVKVG